VRHILILSAILSLLPSISSIADETIAPDWILTDPDGQTIHLQDEVETQATILLFWATWCPYCKALFPHLQSIRLEYGDRVKILAINFREDGDPVAFINDAGYDVTLLLDGDEVADLYGIYGTPGVILLDKDRLIRFDLREIPRIEPPDLGKPASHKRKAAYQAPYWAAEIRKSLDTIIAEHYAGP
jgi:thiol-disulfide isomerase/thioredoxin